MKYSYNKKEPRTPKEILKKIRGLDKKVSHCLLWGMLWTTTCFSSGVYAALTDDKINKNIGIGGMVVSFMGYLTTARRYEKSKNSIKDYINDLEKKFKEIKEDQKLNKDFHYN